MRASGTTATGTRASIGCSATMATAFAGTGGGEAAEADPGAPGARRLEDAPQGRRVRGWCGRAGVVRRWALVARPLAAPPHEGTGDGFPLALREPHARVARRAER